ncbi:MAG: flagellar protein FlaG [Burkholderiales bacterium]
MQISTGGDAPPLPTRVPPIEDKALIPRANSIGSSISSRTDPDQNAIKAAITTANQAMISVNAQVQFQFDSESGRTLVKIVDTESKTVIRQIPTDEILVIARNIDRLQGLIVRGVA